jgi:hypothetical protein
MAVKSKKLTLVDVCERCGVNERTVRRWIKDGLAASEETRSGKRVKIVDSAALDAFLASREEKAKPEPVEKIRAAILDAMASADPDADNIEAALDRISRLERAAYQLAGDGHPDMIRAYKDVAAGRRQLEKDLPEILYRQGRYVDAEKVGGLVTKAVTGMCAELDQVGIAVADLCVGKNAREIRLEVDGAVRRAREHIQRLLEAACQPAK